MISLREVQRRAFEMRIPEQAVERDYVLTAKFSGAGGTRIRVERGKKIGMVDQSPARAKARVRCNHPCRHAGGRETPYTNCLKT